MRKGEKGIAIKKPVVVYLGCNADASHPEGVHVLSVDGASGGIARVESHGLLHAVYLCLSPDGRCLYSCSDTGISSFAVEGERLYPIDAVSTEAGPCHVSVLPDGRHVVWAEYFGGTCGSAEVSDGHFGKVVIHRHSGRGVNLPRQAGPHCHQAVPLPDGTGYCVIDLGLDRVVEYPAVRLFKTSPAGAGPRHLLFHPNGRLAFLVFELGNRISSLSWRPADGFRTLDTLPTLAAQASDRIPQTSLAAAIRFTPDRKRVVVSNRGENSLVAYDFDEATGKLGFKARSMLEGDFPRDFAFVGESLALVAFERSGEVHSLRYDSASGSFETLAKLEGFFRPLALLPKNEVRTA